MASSINTSDKSEGSKEKTLQKPRRPLSAYNLFFKDERAKIISVPVPSTSSGEMTESSEFNKEAQAVVVFSAENVAKTERKPCPHRKISFSDLGKAIGNRWKEIDPKVHEVYKCLAAEDRTRYEKEMEIYKEDLAQMKKAAKNEAARKRKAEKKEAARKRTAAKKEAARKRNAEKKETARKRKKSKSNHTPPPEEKLPSKEKDDDNTSAEVPVPVPTENISLPPEITSSGCDDQYKPRDCGSINTQQSQGFPGIQRSLIPVPTSTLNQESFYHVLRSRALSASLGLFPNYLTQTPPDQQILLQQAQHSVVQAQCSVLQAQHSALQARHGPVVPLSYISSPLNQEMHSYVLPTPNGRFNHPDAYNLVRRN